jgi:hypothetical protein
MLVVGALVLLLPVAALAAPPANDNRASAEVIPTFPATIQGTTVEATVERLDPQVSDCGRVESTLWYRIDQAPDGTVALSLQGTGFSPVLRVYDLVRNGIDELRCDSAGAGAAATVAFRTERGSSYLVLVGKRPGTADASFGLTASLFLPPTNDALKGAKPMRKLPASVKGSTVGATAGNDDPERCDFDTGTVWYSVLPRRAERVIVRLHAAGDLDASVGVVRRVRSQTRTVDCWQTNGKGDAVGVFGVERRARYYLVVGQVDGSPPGDFTLSALPGQAPEKAPGKALPLSGARSTVNGLTDVNDVWWTAMRAGRTYRIGFRSKPCTRLDVSGPFGHLGTLSCNRYTTFTPGPDGGGRYVFEILAPPRLGVSAYSLRLAPAGADDVGVGSELQNLGTVRGTLAPAALDAVDLYHFDAAQRSDVRLRLAKARDRQFYVQLLTDAGKVLTSSTEEINRRVDRGRYVVAVAGAQMAKPGRYALSLAVRQLTKTELQAPDEEELLPGSPLTLTLTTTPALQAGRVEIQIDRFDPLTGWQFNRKLRVPASRRTVTWTPPAAGRWRARAEFLGTMLASPSRSPYVHVIVARPLPAEPVPR